MLNLQWIKAGWILSTGSTEHALSMSILRSLCVYYDLSVYTTISVCILRFLCVYTTISMCILRSLCVYYDFNVYTTISMCILWFLCVYYDLYVCIQRSLCVYYDLYEYTTISMCVSYDIYALSLYFSGCITAEELKFVLTHLPGKVTYKEIDEMIKTVDANGDGKINYQVFFCWHCDTTSHSNTPHPMNRARRWYTVVTLLYDLCCSLAIFDFRWEGWEQITFSLSQTHDYHAHSFHRR